MNKKDILKIIFGSALATTLLSSMANFIASNVHELYGQLAKQMIYKILTSVSLATVFQVLVINLGAAGVAYLYKVWIYNDLSRDNQVIMKKFYLPAKGIITVYSFINVIFIIVNESNGVETIGYILLVLMILTFTEIILRKITMQTKVKNESFLDCRIVLTIISTLLLIYASFSWILSNMKIKEVLLKIRASV